MFKCCVFIGSLAMMVTVGCNREAGGESPEEAFHRLRNAAANKDYDQIVGCLDEKSRKGYALRFIFEALVLRPKAAFLNESPEIKQIGLEFYSLMEDYGVTSDEIQEAKTNQPNKKKAAEAILQKIKYEPEFLVRMFKWADYRMYAHREGLKFDYLTLKDVNIDGESAVGTLLNENGNTSEISFSFEDERWRVETDWIHDYSDL